jgi:hypothetical protein
MATKSLPQSPSTLSPQLKLIGFCAAVITFMVAFTIWSGIPQGDQANAFWLGVGVMTVVLFALGWATWYLLFKPLPAGQAAAVQPISATFRRIAALLLGIGGAGIVVGAFWDEVWHRLYGIPFGQDFFWRPHLLMYFGFGSVTLLAFGSLYVVNRYGKGSFQQRFRANPIIGFLILLGAFLMYVLPADPIWHQIYGNDITAWSVPHLMLVGNWIAMILLSVAIYMTLLASREWGGPLHLSGDDILPLVMLAVMLLMWMQFFTTEWDANFGPAFSRPEWLLPAVIVAGAALVGTMANHTTRRFGSATLTGLIALAARYGLIRLFNVNFMHTHAWVLEIVPLVWIDLWCAYRVLRKENPLWVGSGIAAAVGMTLVLLSIFNQYYPRVTFTSIPASGIAMLAASLTASWCGAKIGDYFASRNKQVEEKSAASRVPLATLGALAAAFVFIVFFITTAAPPVR